MELIPDRPPSIWFFKVEIDVEAAWIDRIEGSACDVERIGMVVLVGIEEGVAEIDGLAPYKSDFRIDG